MPHAYRSLLEVSALYRVSQAVSSSLDLGYVVDRVLAILAEDLGMQRGTLAVLDPDTGDLAIEAAHGLTAEERRRGRYRVGEGITGRVLERGEPMAVPSIGNEPLFLDRTGARRELDRARVAFLCVPVKVGGRAVGVLSADRLPAVGEDLEEDLRVLEIVAGLVAQAVQLRQMVAGEKAGLVRENRRLREAIDGRHRLGQLVGSSPAIRAVFDQVSLASRSPAPVLLTGEPGTGKEFVARTIHGNSDRWRGPFVRVACGAAPPPALEADLFGPPGGGRLAEVGGGTLFLDGVEALSGELQGRVLAEVLGRSDVRVIAAAAVDLTVRVKDGAFLPELHRRLGAVPIHLPPLRARREDIPALAREFLDRCRAAGAGLAQSFAPDALARLLDHPWPGNVRQLEAVVWAAARAAGGKVLGARDLDGPLRAADPGEGPDPLDAAVADLADRLLEDPPPAGVYRTVIDRVDRVLLRRALRATGGVRVRAARLLGINRNTLYAKLDRLEDA